MASRKNEIKKQISELWEEGLDILRDESESKAEPNEEPKWQKKKGKEQEKKEKQLPLHLRYQSWYSKSLPVIRQLMPERYQEFVEQYKIDKRKEIDYLTYTISDYLIGLSVTRGIYKEEVVNPYSAFVTKFQHQIFILYSALERIDSLLTDIEGVLQSELFDSELHFSEELVKKKHLRAGGALAGVTLEVHLKKVCENHSIKFRKKNPTISDYYESLKKGAIIDVPTWRLLQRLGDIRNICVHAKDRDPTKDEVEDLIRGTRKAISELF